MSPAESHSSFERVMTPRLLQILIAVEDLGGVGAAARAHSLPQPSASRSITAAEEHLGYPLLHRTPLGSSLTSEGTALANQARAVLAEYQNLENLARNFNATRATDLSLAASRTVGEQLVPTWLGALAAAIPEVRVSFHVDNSREVIDSVVRGDATLGFVEVPNLPNTDVPLRSEVLRYDELQIVVPPGHVWEGRAVELTELASTPLVERELGSGTRDMLDEALPKRANPSAVFDSNTAIIHAVGAGVGPAVLSELAVREPARTGKVTIAPWAQPPIKRPLRAIWTSTLTAESASTVKKIVDVVRSATQ